MCDTTPVSVPTIVPRLVGVKYYVQLFYIYCNMATSPTQLSLKLMKERGYLCEITERWNPFAKIRQDLFQFIDILCLAPGEIVGVQTTSYSNMSARIKKIREHANFQRVSEAGIRVVVQGWNKKDNRWAVREVEILPQNSLDDLPDDSAL